MRLDAQWLETYLACQMLVALGWIAVASVRPEGSPRRHLWLARVVLLGAVFAPVLVRVAAPPRAAFLPAVLSLDEMPRLDLAKQVEASALGSPAPPGTGSAWPQVDPLWLCGGLVLLGALIQSSRTARDVVRIRRLLRASVVLRSRGRVRVVVSAECGVPFSAALLGKAYVVVPTHMLASPSHARIAILHELQHHRQGDCRAAYGLELLRAIFFWNPCVHRWRSALGELQEFACDEALIARRAFEPYAYGACLVAVAQAASPSMGASRQDVSCAVGMARAGREPASLLRRRIEMLSCYRTSAARRTATGVLAAVTAITTFLGLAYAAQGTLTSPAGRALDLSRVDARLQKIAEAEVKAAQKRFEAKSVAVVVAHPKTGMVVAFAEAQSDPTAETWATRKFAPASTTKPFVTAAALESGAITENQVLECPSPYEVDGKSFHNHDGNRSVQKVSTTEALAQSVNVCTIKMAQATGKERLQRTLHQFGLDDDSLSKGEALSADDVSAVLGVGLRTDLAGMVRAYSMLANNGRSLAPAPVSVVSETTAAAIVRMLVASVDHGTGRKASLSPVSVAGKTGTASVPGSKTPVLALFAGFAPAEAAQLVAFVIVEGEAGGGAAAAPTFREVMSRSLATLDPALR